MKIDEQDQQHSQQIIEQSKSLYNKALKKRQQSFNSSINKNHSRNNHHNMKMIQQQALQHLQAKIYKQRLQNQHRDINISQLKEMINYLQYQRESLLHQFSIQNVNKKQNKNFTKKTLQLEKSQRKYQISNQNISKNNYSHQFQYNLQSLSKEEVLKLLKKTQQFKSFVQYYQNHNPQFLSFLKQSNKKDHQYHKTKVSFSHEYINLYLDDLLKKQGISMNSYHQQQLINKFKKYYEKSYHRHQKELMHSYIDKINKIMINNQEKMSEIYENSKLKQAELINKFKSKFKK